MKKFYLAALVLIASSASYAQWNVSGSPVRKIFTRGEISPMVSKRQDLLPYIPSMRLELLNENFNGVAGALPANVPNGWSTNMVTDADDNQTAAFKIHNSTTANNGGYWPVPITTAGNKFAGANDDGPPCDCDNIDSYLQTPVLDFSTATTVALSFDIYHDQGFLGGDASVQVSTDGGDTFEDLVIGVDENGDDVTVLPVDQDYWQTIIVPVYDLSGQPSVIFRFHWTDDSNWASGFAVDNVVVGELADNDLKADKVKFGNWLQENFGAGVWDYTQVPITQVSPVFASAVVSNIGFNDQTDVGVLFDVKFNGSSVSGSPFASDQTSASFLSLDKDTLSVITDYTPSAIGTVTVEGAVGSSVSDDNTANNTASASMEITNSVYARDANAAQAFVNPEVDYEYGNLFDIYNDDAFGGILFAPGSDSEDGALVIGRVYEWGGLDDDGLPILSDPVAETVEHTVVTAEMNSVGENEFVFLPFFDGVETNAVTLEGGVTYLVTIASAGDVRVPVSGSNVWVSSWLFDADGWAATSSVPMVRLSSDATLNISDVSQTSAMQVNQNMPNPADDYTVIVYNLNNSERVTLTIRDMSGRIVSVQNEGLKMAGRQSIRLNVENMSAGIYNYTLTAGQNSVTKQMMVR